MSDPKVTLLRPAWCDYSIIFGKRIYRFVGGEARAVPETVALALRRKRDENKNPLFKIEEQSEPEIVLRAEKIEPMIAAPEAEKQNVLGPFRQRSLVECLS